MIEILLALDKTDQELASVTLVNFMNRSFGKEIRIVVRGLDVFCD